MGQQEVKSGVAVAGTGATFVWLLGLWANHLPDEPLTPKYSKSRVRGRREHRVLCELGENAAPNPQASLVVFREHALRAGCRVFTGRLQSFRPRESWAQNSVGSSQETALLS